MEKNQDTIQKVLSAAEQKKNQTEKNIDYRKFRLSIASEDDAAEICDVYKAVFSTYPFPIFDPKYIKETIKTHVRYFVVRESGRIIAIASAEMDLISQNVEMTDFATLPDYRGQGLATWLLGEMERQMKCEGILTSYTICRAVSYGINCAFARLDYHWGGTLINNTNIGGQIESMNVWHKGIAVLPPQ